MTDSERIMKRRMANRKYAATHKAQIKAKSDRWNATEKAKSSKKKCREAAKARRMARFDIVEFAKNVYRHRAEITRRRRDVWVTGDELISKDEFIEFCKDNEGEIRELWENWKANGYDRKLTPSLDRIDNNKGYVRGNLQFLTLFENQQKYWSGL